MFEIGPEFLISVQTGYFSDFPEPWSILLPVDVVIIIIVIIIHVIILIALLTEDAQRDKSSPPRGPLFKYMHIHTIFTYFNMK